MSIIPVKIYFGLAMLLAGSVSAYVPARLTAGDYQETHGPGVILWEGESLHLASNDTFVYQHWSDDVTGSRYGAGTHELVGNKLWLHFAAPPPVVIEMRAQPLASPPDSLVLAFVVAGRPAGYATQAGVIPGATILAYDANNQVIASIASDAAGRAVLRLPRKAHRLSVQSLGFVPWQQECPARSTTYELELPANAGTPYVAGTAKEFRLVRGQQSITTLVVKQGKCKTIFQRQPLGQ